MTFVTGYRILQTIVALFNQIHLTFFFARCMIMVSFLPEWLTGTQVSPPSSHIDPVYLNEENNYLKVFSKLKFW